MQGIVKLTNKVAVVTLIALVYWVFIFIAMEVFDFKVFRENITELFGFSILGLLAILFGAVVLNVMLNMTIIAENNGREDAKIGGKKLLFYVLAFISSLLLIFSFLFMGDRATSQKKERHLVNSVKTLLDEHRDIVDELLDYEFTVDYMDNASRKIKLLSKIDENFPGIEVLLPDKINNVDVVLSFGGYFGYDKKKKPQKVDFIFSASAAERDYLERVFNGQESDYLFSSHDGKYEIYFPVKKGSDTVVFYLSQYMRYGKIGS